MFHIYIISSSYFRYATITSFSTRDGKEQETINNMVPNLALCMRYTDILDYDRLHRLTGKRFSRSEAFPKRAHIQSQLTLRQLFDLTPAADSTLSACYYRSDDGFLFDLHYRSVCQQIFSIERFYVNQFMCYLFRPDSRFDFPLSIAKKTLLSPSLYYGVRLSNLFWGMDFFIASVFYNDYPFVSLHYAPGMRRMEVFAASIPYYRAATFTYYWIQNELLPVPYDTACMNTQACSDDCWDRMESMIDRVSYFRIVPENKYDHMDRQHVNYNDLMNGTKRNMIASEMKRCRSLCSGSWCSYSYTVTELQASRRAHLPNESMSVYVQSERMPGVFAIAMPKIDLMAFLIYLSSCLEIWLGAHLLTISRLYKRLEKRIRRRLKENKRKRRRIHRRSRGNN